MNSQRLSIIVIPAVLLLATMLATISVFSSGGNQLGSTFVMLTVVSCIIGFLSPKSALLVFVVLQFYSDFLKRLLILGDSLSQEDVMVSLGMGPALIVATCLSCTLQSLFGKRPFSWNRDGLFCLGCIAVSVSGSMLGSIGGAPVEGSRSIIEIGQAMLGSSMLGMTAFAGYLLLNEASERSKALKWLVIGAIPMGLYAMYQWIFGISAWEENYIKTGLSSILYLSYTTSGGIDQMRPFSTLNVHVSLGAAGGTLAVVCIFIMMRYRYFFQGGRRLNWVYFPISLIFLLACFVSQNRTTYFLPFFAVVALIAFSGRWRTILFYSSGLLAFAILVLSSDWINEQILYWSVQFESTTLGAKFGTLGTYQDRLKGFIALSEARNWSPFGLAPQDRPFYHDQFTEALVKVGYIPLGLALAALFSCIAWWHSRCLGIGDPVIRKFMIALTAVIVSLGICSFIYGNMAFVTPINSILGLLIGIGMATIRQHTQDARRFHQQSLSPVESSPKTTPYTP